MTSRCENSTICPGGNCPGCKDGQPFCGDPRCSPHCNGCLMPENHDAILGWVVVILIICLLAITFIVWYIYGSKWFTPHSDHLRAGVVTPNNVGMYLMQPNTSAYTY